MKQLDNLDFVNSSSIRNLLLPSVPNDGVSKLYSDRKRAFYSEIYIPPSLATAITSSNVNSDIAVLALPTSTALHNIRYLIKLSLNLSTTAGATGTILEIYYGVGTVVGTAFVRYTPATRYVNDLFFWATIPANQTVKVRWRNLALGFTVTYTFNTLIPSFSLTGYPENLFTLP